MNWFDLVPVPVALGMVLYVSQALEKHEKNCPVNDQIKDMGKKIDMILEHLLGKRY